jgi:predicted NAD/FAD-binding protein
MVAVREQSTKLVDALRFHLELANKLETQMVEQIAVFDDFLVLREFGSWAFEQFLDAGMYVPFELKV